MLCYKNVQLACTAQICMLDGTEKQQKEAELWAPLGAGRCYSKSNASFLWMTGLIVTLRHLWTSVGQSHTTHAVARWREGRE